MPIRTERRKGQTRSPWTASAKTGATGQTYEIRTVADFLAVPEARRRVCLREFHSWLAVQESIPALINAAAGALGSPLPSIQMREPDVFRWIDDGKATINVLLEPSGAMPIRTGDHS